MRNRIATILTMALTFIFLVNTEIFSSTIEFKDGQTHNIDYQISHNDIWVDYQSPGMNTTVNFIQGGSTDNDLHAYTDSRINIISGGSGMRNITMTMHERSIATIWNGYAGSVLLAQDNSRVSYHGGVVGSFCAQNESNVIFDGGLVESWFKAGDNSQVIISGGNINIGLETAQETQVTIMGGLIGGQAETGFITRDNSKVDILGGTLSRNLELQGDSIVTISGGIIAGENDIIVGTYSDGINATLNLIGRDFTVDGQSIGYGEITSLLRGDWRDDSWRHLTGTLANGDLIDNDFKIGYDARIILIPEQATLLLLGLGAVMLNKKSLRS